MIVLDILLKKWNAYLPKDLSLKSRTNVRYYVHKTRIHIQLSNRRFEK